MNWEIPVLCIVAGVCARPLWVAWWERWRVRKLKLRHVEPYIGEVIY